ncbi:hypothetical protein [Qipengyuania sphaerica]|uniref:hypothetical protein n=1 Tax=Qipengyuania sphaerica TaxID=2867243 RepID=UPI001C874A2C|nr:hypothetical protein [Qipengyuania sphaerica]MBX7540983.1 hypothetical protein [Qipengyuania sphaerica]
MEDSWPLKIARWILGGWFLFSAALFFAARIFPEIQVPADGSPQAEAFMGALRESGFISPLMYFFFVTGGLATLFHRSAPLGLVLLGPFVTVIFFYHLVLTGSWPWGTFWFALLLGLVWAYRARLSALWTLPETSKPS